MTTCSLSLCIKASFSKSNKKMQPSYTFAPYISKHFLQSVASITAWLTLLKIKLSTMHSQTLNLKDMLKCRFFIFFNAQNLYFMQSKFINLNASNMIPWRVCPWPILQNELWQYHSHPLHMQGCWYFTCNPLAYSQLKSFLYVLL